MDSSSLKALTVVFNTRKDRGGAVRIGLRLGDAIGSRIDADICKMESPHDTKLFSDLSIDTDVVQLPQKEGLKLTADTLLRRETDYTNVIIYTQLPDEITLSDYDIIHFHNPIPLAAMAQMAIKCKRAGVPYCITTHGISKLPDTPDTEDLSWWQVPVFRYGFFVPYLQVLKNAEHLFANSERDKQLLQDYFPNQSISVTPNGVELAPPQGEAASLIEDKYGISEDIPVLLFVGKILQGKGIDDLIHVHNSIETPHRTIVVGDPEDPEYVDKLQSTDDSLLFVGYKHKDELNQLYKRADLFVFPTRSDVFPLVVLEAMAAKTPVVSTTVGGIPEQVTDDVGRLVPPRNPQKMTEEIDEILNNQDQLKQMSCNSIKRIKNKFSWDQIAKSVVDEYYNMI